MEETARDGKETLGTNDIEITRTLRILKIEVKTRKINPKNEKEPLTFTLFQSLVLIPNVLTAYT